MPASLSGDAGAVVETRTQQRRLMIGLYATAAFLYWAALYLYVPTLPTYVESKTGTYALVGIVLAQYGLWQAVVRLPLGIAADWLGWHKPLLLIGFALSGLGALVMGSANGVGLLTAGRAITGLAAATWVPLIVAFSGLFEHHEAVRATAMLTLASSVGRMIASAVTGSLNEVGGYGLAFFLAAGAAGLSMVSVLFIQEQRRPVRRPSLAGTGRLVTRRDVLLPAILAAVSQYANWGATFSFMPIMAQRLGASDVTLSLLLSMHIGVVTLGNLAATAIANRIGARHLVYISFVLLAAGLTLAAVAPSLALIFVAQFVLGLAQGIGYPVLMALSIRYVSSESRTTAMGLHQAVYAIGMFAGPSLSGVLAEVMGIQPMFGLTAGACLVFGIGMTRLLRAKDEE